MENKGYGMVIDDSFRAANFLSDMIARDKKNAADEYRANITASVEAEKKNSEE